MIRNQKGFTLIEIIAVLVILGILAAVAIPKYMAMQEDARNAAGSGALAAGATNVSMAYARMLIDNNVAINDTSLATKLTGNTTSNFTTVGDYTLSYAAGTTSGTIDINIVTGQFGTPRTKNVRYSN